MKKEDSQLISTKGFLSFQILHELRLHRRCGDELASIIGSRKGNKLTPGTIYPALKFLRRKKLLAHKKNGRKKIYTITELGLSEYSSVRKNFLYIFDDIIKTSKQKLKIRVINTTKGSKRRL